MFFYVILIPSRTLDIFAVFFALCFVVLLAGQESGCVVRRAQREKSTQIYASFLLGISINRITALHQGLQFFS